MQITSNEFLAFTWITLGILVSGFYEPAMKYLFPVQTRGMTPQSFWTLAKPYVARFVASVVIGIVVLAISVATSTQIATWWQAFLIGFGVNRTVNILQGFKNESG